MGGADGAVQPALCGAAGQHVCGVRHHARSGLPCASPADEQASSPRRDSASSYCCPSCRLAHRCLLQSLPIAWRDAGIARAEWQEVKPMLWLVVILCSMLSSGLTRLLNNAQAFCEAAGAADPQVPAAPPAGHLSSGRLQCGDLLQPRHR